MILKNEFLVAFLPECRRCLIYYFKKAYGYTLAQISNPSIPSPFNSEENITFADGSEVGQSVPFWPLIQPERKVDFM